MIVLFGKEDGCTSLYTAVQKKSNLLNLLKKFTLLIMADKSELKNERWLENQKEKTFKDLLVEENTLILKAIKEHGYEELGEEKILDLISAIVYRRLRNAFPTNNSQQKASITDEKSGFGFLNMLFVISFIFAAISYIDQCQIPLKMIKKSRVIKLIRLMQ